MITQAEKDTAVNTSVTLNGKPAVIRGRKLKFPKVCELNSPLAVEYAWETVLHVINNGGHFKASY